MNYNFVKVDGTVYPVIHNENVGFYVDVNGQAVTKPTKDELVQELQRRYSDVTPMPE